MEHEQQRLLAFGEQVLALLADGEQGQQDLWSADGALSTSKRRAKTQVGALLLGCYAT